MEIPALCTIIASLRLSPSISQYFQYQTITLSCGDWAEWKLKRNTSIDTNAECSTWGQRNQSQCFLFDAYPLDSGLYWCEYGAGECSNAVNITVTDGPVVLDGPVLPVQVGQSVTLRCLNQTFSSSSNLTATFYKDGHPIGSSPSGTVTIASVARSDEGFYMCNVSAAGGSAQSWLTVTAGDPVPPHSPLARVLLPVGGIGLVVVSMALLCFRRRFKGAHESDVSYSEVTITQEPTEHRGLDPTETVYCSVKTDSIRQETTSFSCSLQLRAQNR